jgi:hypothetical protein
VGALSRGRRERHCYQARELTALRRGIIGAEPPASYMVRSGLLGSAICSRIMLADPGGRFVCVNGLDSAEANGSE